MTIAEIFLEDFDAMASNTRRVIERVPEDKPEWTPHDKSMKMGKLAMHCATMLLFGYYILEDDGMDMANSKREQSNLTFKSREDALAQFDDAAAKCRAALSAASDEHMMRPWKFSFGEHVISHHSRAKSFRIFCFDHMIHHTAQLGVYLRLNDIPVPALYGPSADEQF